MIKPQTCLNLIYSACLLSIIIKTKGRKEKLIENKSRSIIIAKEKGENIHAAHLLNYRIAFDAMRAYHVSEIEHKRDMITILNNILISIVTVFAGVFYFILSPEYDLYNTASLFIIIVIAALYVVLIARLKRINTNKFKGDNNRYEKFRIECYLEREYLLLNDYFKKINEYDTIYWNRKDFNKKSDKNGAESGYIKTILIVSDYCNLLLSIVICLSLISITLVVEQIGYFSC